MPVIPINKDYTNITDFVNSLFSAGVRDPSVVTNAIAAGELSVGFSDQGKEITRVWLAAWQSSQGDPFNQTDFDHCPQLDRPLMAFIAGYLRSNALSMFMPKLEYLGPSAADGPPIYQLSGYTRHDFRSGGKWNYDTVQSYLNLLMFGAHFVVIMAKADLPNGPEVSPLWQDFKAESTLRSNQRNDPGNSHYTTLTNICGQYYPAVSGDTPPDPTPFVLACLVCPTVAEVTCLIKPPGSYDTFMQLEGWEAVSDRHNADFEAFNATLWNISTYGSCVYSEKRATAIFLAPAGWKPQPTPGTFMPPYVGAETPQPWLRTDLVRLADEQVERRTRRARSPG